MGLCFLWRLRGRIFQASLLASGGSLACVDITPSLCTEFFSVLSVSKFPLFFLGHYSYGVRVHPIYCLLTNCI